MSRSISTDPDKALRNVDDSMQARFLLLRSSKAEILYAKHILNIELAPYQVFIVKLLRGVYKTEAQARKDIEDLGIEWVYDTGRVRFASGPDGILYPNNEIMLPAGFGKTTLVRLVCDMEAHDNPNSRNQLIFKNEKEANAMSGAIRGDLTSPRAKEIFGDPMPKDAAWSNERFSLAWRQWGDIRDNFEFYGMTSDFVGKRCIVPGSMVVTSKGCIPAEKIAIHDRVLTHKGRFQKVVDTSARPAKEPVYRIHGAGQYSSSWMTGDHEVLIWRDNAVQWARADSVKRGDYLPIPIPLRNGCRLVLRNTEENAEFQRIAKQDGFWRLYGYYVAEGWTLTKQRTVKLAFREGEEWIDDATNLARDVLGVEPYSRLASENCREVSFTHPVFWKLARMCGGNARDKQVPYWVKRASTKHQREFLLGYWRGDGCYSNEEVQITTASLSLARDVQELLSGWGISSRVHKLRDAKPGTIRGRHINQSAAWVLSSADPTLKLFLTGVPQEPPKRFYSPWSFFIPGYRCVLVTKVESKPYEGPVYDISVDVDHSFVLTDCTVHNCDRGISDDVETDKTARTNDACEALIAAFNNGPFTHPKPLWIRDKNGKVQIPKRLNWPDRLYWGWSNLGTIFHPHGLHARCEHDPTFNTVVFDCFRDRRQTQSLDDRMMTAAELHAKRQSLGVLSFNKRYRNIAVDPTEMTFKEESLRGGDVIAETGERIHYSGCLDGTRSYGDYEENWDLWLGFDPATGSKSRWAAFSAYVIVGVEEREEEFEKHIYLVDYLKTQVDYSRQLDILLDGNPQLGIEGFMTKYPLDGIVIEKNNHGMMAVGDDRVKPYIASGLIRPSYTGTQKLDPLVGVPALAPMIEQGRFHLPYKTAEDQNRTESFIVDMVEFHPVRDKRDLVMALWLATIPARAERKESRTWHSTKRYVSPFQRRLGIR